MQLLRSLTWLNKTVIFTIAALLLTFVPVSAIGLLGGICMLTLLPGAQWLRWLGLYRHRWNFTTVTLSLVLGLVTSPIVIYWGSLLFGFSRGLLLVLFPLYIIVLAGWVSRRDLSPEQSAPEPKDSSQTGWIVAALLIGFAVLGPVLAYFELETAQGYYPVQMEDWQKHYGVAFALRHTGVPPISPFFYGMFPDEQLVYYYFLHLTGAALDLLQSGGPYLHQAFVSAILLAALSFGCTFLLLAQTLFGSHKVAVWSLAFATVIGGLDIIPILHRTGQDYRQHFPDGPIPLDALLPRQHIDNWVSALSLRLNTFYSYYIWVPQHLTGLTILCLGCFLYLRVTERRKLLVILPLLLFALLGHSTWIAVIGSGCLFLFALLQIVATYRRQGVPAARSLFLGYAVIAGAFGLVAAPFILTLIGPTAPKSGIAFEIPKLDSWSLLRPFQANFGPTLWARLLDLPLHLFIEMGPLLVAGLAGLIYFWIRQKQNLAHHQPPHPQPPNLPISQSPLPTPNALLPFFSLLLITGLLTVNLFASGRGWAELGLIQNNDLGLRASMPGQLVLALFAGYFMARWPALRLARRWKWPLTGGLALLIGLGTLYAGWEFTAMGLAKYSTKPQLSPDAYQTLRDMSGVTPPQEKPLPVVAHRQHRGSSRFQLSLGSRPVVFSTGEVVVFHNDVSDLALALELSEKAFDNSLPVWSYQMFQNLGADYIFVDPAARDPVRHPEKYRHPPYFEPVYRRGNYEIYKVQPLPYPPEQMQAQFDENGIRFTGYFIDSTPQYPGQQTTPTTPGLVTAWQLTRPTGKNYTTFIHFVDPAGNIVAQADHQLWAWDVNYEGPTTTWTPQLTHLDIAPLPEAALATNTPLTIRIGLWLPESGQQFPPQSQSLQIDAGGRLIIGTLGD